MLQKICRSVVRAPIVGKDEEDSVYSNYNQKKLFIHKERVGN